MRKGSQKPCPGCGEIRSNRRVTEVCRHCEADLAYARKIRTELENQEETVVASFGDRHYSNEYISTKARTGEALQRIFLDLTRSVSVPVNQYHADFPDLLGKDDGSSMRTYARISLATAREINRLYRAVQDALKKEYEAGKADGHRVLMRLADGDLSMNEFDEIATRATKK